MRILYGIESMDKVEPGSVITIGSFDGVHTGHVKLLSTLRDIADRNNKKSLIITFNPHPQKVLKKLETDFLLTTLEERLALIEKTGFIDDVLVLKFDRSFSELNPSEFIKSIIIDMIKPSHITVGYDTHFGKDRMGDIVFLKNITQRINITVDTVNPHILSEEPVSSTEIRRLLRYGKVQEANRILGYRYFIKGNVVKGEGRGALLGFPTANIEITDKSKIMPQKGVYAVKVVYQNKEYRGVLNVGSRPTFENNALPTVEVHVIGLNENLYSKMLKINFVARLRDEVKFATNEELIEQLKIDIENQKKI